jgi:hypothetical protein
MEGRIGLFTMITALAIMLFDLYLYNRQHQ